MNTKEMNCGRTRVCLCYIASAALITAFLYLLFNTSVQRARDIDAIREDLNEISHVVLHNQRGSPNDPSTLAEVVESIIKNRLNQILDEIYAIKKQFKGTTCFGLSKGPTKAVIETVIDQINYASEDLGAKIYKVIAEPLYGSNFIRNFLSLDFASNPPVNMLRPSMQPGCCFAFKNNQSEITIKLAKTIFLQQIEMEHISKELSPTEDISTAPKDFILYGVDISYDKEILIARLEYSNNPSSRKQIFPVSAQSKFQFIRITFLSNHGHPSYTCIYRVAVYGSLN